MTGRQRLLADIEARRLDAEKRRLAGDPVEVLSAELTIAAEDAGYDPYDNPGHAKPLVVERLGKMPPRRRRR